MEDRSKTHHGSGAFILSGVSFIPLIGVIPGIICIINALVSRKENSKKLGLIGFSGVMLTVVLYGIVLPAVFNSKSIGKSFEPHAISAMTSLVRHIEYFKLQNDAYPKSIAELRSNLKQGELVFTHDVSGPLVLGEQHREFYYEVVNDGNNYLLFGIGQDAVAFTADDIYPLIDEEKDKNVGWVKPNNDG
ncbi:hypothetical protein KJ365_01340 [Glaciecola sp. XM2]|uniref:hypothetical protein n=1 Tax=Glaciecola sp. XM2 TaxID=1914931 RepID=UPI001BDEA5C6|nr:hypothetical protein [Glaciecola sp. XM2]MBT1449510.1 hypothetical protein [Glaciecola sp. XM2]